MKTAFQVQQHGFPFVNSWQMKHEERAELRQTIAAGTGQAAGAAGNDPFGMIRNLVTTQISGWIDAAMPDYYGLCGGMAFAAADHFRAGRPAPYGVNPNVTPNGDDPTDKAIRDYLWQRQLESLKPNASVLLTWMTMLHLPVPGAGPLWLRDRTREQFNNLFAFLKHGPWPLCLIGSSTSPFNNHQVLAIGAVSNGDWTGTIFLYDSNCPGSEQTITLDLRGDDVRAVETCSSPERGPLRGFFCEHYTPAPPPDLPRASKPKPATKPARPTKPAPKPAKPASSMTKPTTKKPDGDKKP